MKRPLAYITAAWCGIPEVDTDLAVEFCRAAYEAGLAEAMMIRVSLVEVSKSTLIWL